MIGAKAQSIRTVQAYVNPDEGTRKKYSCYWLYESDGISGFSIISCANCSIVRDVYLYSMKDTCN